VAVRCSTSVVVPLLGFPSPPAPAGVVIHLEDNGHRGDRVNFSFVSSLPTSCPPPPTVDENTDGAGNVTVIDAQSSPTSKDQCKNGGWRIYGTTFANQGDCVSFVATAAKRGGPRRDGR
jgi:hypothetical protein